MKLALLIAIVFNFSSLLAQRVHTYEKCIPQDADFKLTKNSVKQGYNTVAQLSASHLFSVDIEVTLKSELQTWQETTFYDDGDLVDADGSTSDWNGFFTIVKEKKAKALSNLVKGIGMSTAHILVKKNAFTNKPGSWNAFINVIKTYQEQHDLPNLVKNVEKYNYSNKISLGYLVATQGEERTEKKLLETYRDTQKAHIKIDLDRNLLDTESETITIESGFCDRKNSPNVYTNDRYYTIRTSNTYFGTEILGTRKQVNFSSRGFSYVPTQENGTLILKNLKLTNSQQVLQDISHNNGSVEFSGIVECLSEKQGSFWKGRSKEDKAKDKASRKVINFFKLTQVKNGVFNTGVQTGCDFKAIVSLDISLKGSSYYNSSTKTKQEEIQLR